MAGRKRNALGSSPIDRVLSPPRPAKSARRRAKEPAELPKETAVEEPQRAPSVTSKRVTHTFRLSEELLGECRAAVIALAGAPVRLTLSDLVESALQRELERLKRKYNDGEGFPTYDGTLRAGRPIGS